MCGLHHQESAPDEVEIAWRLASRALGAGLRERGGDAWAAYGFDGVHLPRLISMTDHDNVRSRGVMERLGMVFDHEARIVDEGQEFEAVVYVLTVDRWRGSAGHARRSTVNIPSLSLP